MVGAGSDQFATLRGGLSGRLERTPTVQTTMIRSINPHIRRALTTMLAVATLGLAGCETMAITAAGAAATAATDAIMGRKSGDDPERDTSEQDPYGWGPANPGGGSCTIICGGRRAAIACSGDEIPVCSCEPTPVTRCELAPVTPTPAGKREEPETEELGEVEEQEFSGNPILLPEDEGSSESDGDGAAGDRDGADEE